MNIDLVLTLAALMFVCPPLLVAIISFDQVIRIQFAEFPTEWKKEGYLIGFFWRPPKDYQQLSVYALGWAIVPARMLQLTFSTPPWAAKCPSVRRLIWRMRICIVIGNLSAVLVFVPWVILKA